MIAGHNDTHKRFDEVLFVHHSGTSRLVDQLIEIKTKRPTRFMVHVFLS